MADLRECEQIYQIHKLPSLRPEAANAPTRPKALRTLSALASCISHHHRPPPLDTKPASAPFDLSILISKESDSMHSPDIDFMCSTILKQLVSSPSTGLSPQYNSLLLHVLEAYHQLHIKYQQLLERMVAPDGPCLTVNSPMRGAFKTSTLNADQSYASITEDPYMPNCQGRWPLQSSGQVNDLVHQLQRSSSCGPIDEGRMMPESWAAPFARPSDVGSAMETHQSLLQAHTPKQSTQESSQGSQVQVSGLSAPQHSEGVPNVPEAYDPSHPPERSSLHARGALSSTVNQSRLQPRFSFFPGDDKVPEIKNGDWPLSTNPESHEEVMEHKSCHIGVGVLPTGQPLSTASLTPAGRPAKPSWGMGNIIKLTKKPLEETGSNTAAKGYKISHDSDRPGISRPQSRAGNILTQELPSHSAGSGLAIAAARAAKI